MDARTRWRDDVRMPSLNLSDLELEAAARACRALAYAEEQAAKKMENPGMRAAALAERFEKERKRA